MSIYIHWVFIKKKFTNEDKQDTNDSVNYLDIINKVKDI